MTPPDRESLRFTKMHGAGNDYVLVDGFSGGRRDRPAALARRLCDRRTGVGADGLILAGPAAGADVAMVILNADGSRARMCGNGLRCTAAFHWATTGGQGDGERVVMTDSGARRVGVRRLGPHRFEATAGLGVPGLARPVADGGSGPLVDAAVRVGSAHLALTVVSMGNPHCVLWVDDLEAADVAGIGAALQQHALFPDGVNVSFVRRRAADLVDQRTFERGAGETAACGTGAAAATVAGVLSGRTGRRVRSRFAGGILESHWPKDAAEVLQTGPVTAVFEGRWFGEAPDG